MVIFAKQLNLKKSLNILPSFLLLLLVFAGCKKATNILGSDVQPANDGLNAISDDKAVVYAYTKKGDFTGSLNNANKYLGANNDPYFGKTEMGLYVNANFTGVNLTFGSSLTIQSSEIILTVDASSRAGDFESAVSYSVYTIDSTLYSNRLYYTNNTKFHSESNLLSTNISLTSKFEDREVIRIPIPNSHAVKILNKDTLKNVQSFQAEFKGFYIKCSTVGASEGVIYRVKLEDDKSGFYINYKSGSEAKSVRFTFGGSTAARFNTVNYDYSAANTNLKGQLNGDTTLGATNVYLKGMGLSRVSVLIPSLKSYADSFKVAVNRAELVFNIDPTVLTEGEKYRTPSKLTLLAVDSLGKEQYVIDQTNATDFSRYDGGYDSNNNRYVFNISRHVQAILSGTRKNYGFYLVMADPEPPFAVVRDAFIERAAFYGTNKNGVKPITFNLSYLKFPKD